MLKGANINEDDICTFQVLISDSAGSDGISSVTITAQIR